MTGRNSFFFCSDFKVLRDSVLSELLFVMSWNFTVFNLARAYLDLIDNVDKFNDDSIPFTEKTPASRNG